MNNNQHRKSTFAIAVLVIGIVIGVASDAVAQHQDMFFGHSPPDPNPPPGQECTTLEPLKLFVADNDAVGGAIPPGGGEPADPGAVITLNPVVFTANLADPARGGFVFAGSQPGLNYIGVDNLCHGMSTSFTGGQFFETYMRRLFFDDGVDFAMTQGVTPILAEDGTEWRFGDSNNGGHTHAFFLTHRPGQYLAEFFVTASVVFTPSDPFTLRFATDPECFASTVVDMSDVFNADVVDSDSADAPLSFDDADHHWLLNDLYGTDRGIPVDGVLDVFQLGGSGGVGLTGSNGNCLFDDGTRSTAATIDLIAQALTAPYLSVELLIGAAGDFTCLTGQSCDKLVARLTYDTGLPQVVNIRRLALPVTLGAVYVPLNDWHVAVDPPPLLAVGPGGRREGGGFARSDGSGIDATPDPIDGFYLQRVTFPLDASRALRAIAFDDYTDDGRVGVFAITLIAEIACCDGDFDQNGNVDLADFAGFDACADADEATPWNTDCDVFDCNRNQLIELLDFGSFQARFSDSGE